MHRVPKPIQVGPWDWELQENFDFSPTKYMVQCLLFSEDNVGVLVSWVPQELAKKDKKVKIEDRGINGIYVVKDVYLSSLSEEKEVLEKSKSSLKYLKARKFFDV